MPPTILRRQRSAAQPRAEPAFRPESLMNVAAPDATRTNLAAALLGVNTRTEDDPASSSCGGCSAAAPCSACGEKRPRIAPKVAPGAPFRGTWLPDSALSRLGSGAALDAAMVPLPAPEPVHDNCGPDVTDWFVGIMNAAKRDRRVLAIQRDLTEARSGAAAVGLSTTNILEGGVLLTVLAAERAAGNPTRTAAASVQIASADPGN